MNSLNQNLKNKTVVINSELLPGSPEDRAFLCESGFGCDPQTGGRAIFGKFIRNGMKAKVDGMMLERVL